MDPPCVEKRLGVSTSLKVHIPFKKSHRFENINPTYALDTTTSLSKPLVSNASTRAPTLACISISPPASQLRHTSHTDAPIRLFAHTNRVSIYLAWLNVRRNLRRGRVQPEALFPEEVQEVRQVQVSKREGLLVWFLVHNHPRHLVIITIHAR